MDVVEFKAITPKYIFNDWYLLESFSSPRRSDGNMAHERENRYRQASDVYIYEQLSLPFSSDNLSLLIEER